MRDDLFRLESCGYDAVIVGESLRRTPDPLQKLCKL